MNLWSVVSGGDKRLDWSENANLHVFGVVESREEEIVACGITPR